MQKIQTLERGRTRTFQLPKRCLWSGLKSRAGAWSSARNDDCLIELSMRLWSDSTLFNPPQPQHDTPDTQTQEITTQIPIDHPFDHPELS